MPHCAAYGQATPPPATRNHIQLNKPGRLLPVEQPFKSPALVQTCAACLPACSMPHSHRRLRLLHVGNKTKKWEPAGSLAFWEQPDFSRLLIQNFVYMACFRLHYVAVSCGRLLGNQPPVVLQRWEIPIKSSLQCKDNKASYQMR